MGKKEDDKWDDGRIDDVIKRREEELRESEERQKNMGDEARRNPDEGWNQRRNDERD